MTENAFNVNGTAGVEQIPQSLLTYYPKEVIFFQGDIGDHVLHIRSGEVTIAVATLSGKEAIVGVLGPGAFLGEEALAGRQCRVVTATAMTHCTLQVVRSQQMWDLLQHEHDFREHFVSSMLSRTIRLEYDLVDQMLNSAKQRLARVLLRLAEGDPHGATKISQETLAGMVGTTRSRVNHFMNEFKRRGHVTYEHQRIKVNRSLRRLVEQVDDAAAVVA